MVSPLRLHAVDLSHEANILLPLLKEHSILIHLTVLGISYELVSSYAEEDVTRDPQKARVFMILKNEHGMHTTLQCKREQFSYNVALMRKHLQELGIRCPVEMQFPILPEED